jgi:hypothetical protein
MRVRFPSPALTAPAQVGGTLSCFYRHFYHVRSGRRARCVPDGFGVLPVFLVLLVFASAKSLSMPAAIFWSRSRVACRYMSAARELEWPIRSISSLRLAPCAELVGSGLPTMLNGLARRPADDGIFPRCCAFSFFLPHHACV